jgi:hypothetical protein
MTARPFKAVMHQTLHTWICLEDCQVDLPGICQVVLPGRGILDPVLDPGSVHQVSLVDIPAHTLFRKSEKTRNGYKRAKCRYHPLAEHPQHFQSMW